VEAEMSDRVVLITGGARGAGLGIASVLAAEGGRVVICDIDDGALEAASATLRAAGGDVRPVLCDVSDEAAVERMFAKIHDLHGRLDVLVNAVAWLDPPGPISAMVTASWQQALHTNLDGLMFCTRAALGLMIPRRSGTIINISSINGMRGFPQRAAYGATKAAINNFTQTTAMENRKYGIRANCLAPGGIAGERMKIIGEMMASGAAEENGGAIAYPDPPRELLQPEAVGRYVAWLASEHSRDINGQVMVIGDTDRSPLQALFPDL
jgi:NAD(P)-dependent dehydrogenase (short-subunit alcohol dehydrogenase family)